MTAAGAALPVLGYLGMAALLAHEVAFGVRHATRCRTNKIGHKCSCSLPHRFLAGSAFHGYVVTDATYWRQADNTDGHVSPFQKLPKWKRRVLRTGPVLAVFGLLISWPLTGAAVAVLGVAAGCWLGRQRAAGWAGRLIPGRLRERLGRHHGRRKHDLAGGLADITKTASVAVKPQIEWHPDYASAEPGDDVVTWYPPSGFRADPRQKAQVEDLFRGRVGFELVPKWQLDAMPARVVFARARQLPDLVYLHEVLERVEALPADKTAIGLDDQGNLVCWDWSCESPHGLLNAGSRHGKTETEMAMVGQVIRKGGRVLYVDVKRVSIQGMKGVPGLTLCDNPRDMVGIWLAIDAWGKDLDERIDARTKDPTAQFPRDLLVLEEVNQLSEMFDEFWENWPHEDEEWKNTILWKPKRAKLTPPIWRVVKKGVWEGAFCDKNVLIAGQNIEAQTVKGVRNSIGLRLLGGYQPQNWKALVGTTPVPPAPPVKGRWCLVNGSSQTWVQALIADLDANASAAIWRDYARASRRMDGTLPAAAGAMTEIYHVDSNGQVSAVKTGVLKSATDLDASMSLSEIVGTFLLPRGSREEQKKLTQMLRQDRHRSDKGELPDGLEFPKRVKVRDDGWQTEEFVPSQVIEFNMARRGSRR